jgi:hypothetical protein
MSALQHCRWYATKAATSDDHPIGDSVSLDRNVVRKPDGNFGKGRRWILHMWADWGGVHVDVTGRSPQHVDRLARDWIAHGVSPTKDGGRGVRENWHLSAEPAAASDRWLRAEARATKVERR